ncbi:hypothetical protein, conserved [Eimeria tenella]|uniref:Protein kinase domain-containing protein n=1 Tax=Eimeria tenella TaxID=5802 RepID=U6KGC4_EIMTE|nr:hypothetical protein, conserved [Eimeria tenella]CDJ37090.1 hypothetical protein, conserved [Eimeria tenella]|eukprot:XP_013227928.1 hypothetical protein, conserved [Eimeria tenella]
MPEWDAVPVDQSSEPASGTFNPTTGLISSRAFASTLGNAVQSLDPVGVDAYCSDTSAKVRSGSYFSRSPFIFALLLGTLLAAVVGASLLQPALSGSARRDLQRAWQAVKSKDAPWDLPTLDQYEQHLSLSEARGKALLAAAAKKRGEIRFPFPRALGQSAMATLAEQLSGGRTTNLIGQTLILTDIQPLGSTEIEQEPREYIVSKYLGEGALSVVVEVIEKRTNETKALRLHAIPQHLDSVSVTPELAEDASRTALVESTTAMLQAVGTTSLTAAAKERGLALVSAVARVQGVPSVLPCGSSYFVNEVEIVDRYYGTVEGLFSPTTRLTEGAKVYAGRRLLLQVLLLQRAGCSHNNLKLQNLFMNLDGSFLLGDFGAGSLIGEPLDRVRGVTPAYAEKELSLAATVTSPDAPPARVHSKSDLWGLGMCLYQIFTGGEMPYGLGGDLPASDIFDFLEKNKVRAVVLDAPLTSARVSARWKDLIIRLLEVERENRIGTEQLIEEFADLLQL